MARSQLGLSLVKSGGRKGGGESIRTRTSERRPFAPLTTMVSNLASAPPVPSSETQTSPLRLKRAKPRRPRILIVTPELNGSSFLGKNGHGAPCAKAGGLADISTLLVDELSARGVDVRVAMP